MKAQAVKRIGVVGAGLMGHGIALELALAGHDVRLASRNQTSVEKGLASIEDSLNGLIGLSLVSPDQAALAKTRINTHSVLADAVSDAEVVIESVYEDLRLKQDIFHELDGLCPEHTILASNTSGLPITDLGARMVHQDRIAGSHFVQPGHIVPVVEVIRGRETSDETMSRTCEIWERLGRITLRVNQDVPGFLVNRLQHAIIREAVHLLATGVADAETIDQAVSLGLAPRFTTAGPLEQRDINGLRTNALVAGHLWKTLASWEEPLAYVQAMVARGETGLEAGKGYYDWSGQDPVTVRGDKDELLLRRTEQVMADWRAKKKSEGG